MSLTSIVDQLKKLSADKRVHFVIQSLNGFEMHKQLLKEDSLEICNIFEKELKFLKEKSILKNDYISYFKGYTLLGSNVCPFGYETVDGFHSELLVLEKNE